MKRWLVLGALLVIFLLPVANPSMSSIPAAIVDEAFDVPFLTAADGDVSSESIGEDYSHKFRETSDDDVMQWPDAPWRSSTEQTDDGWIMQGDIHGSSTATHTGTHTKDGDYYGAADAGLPSITEAGYNLTLSDVVEAPLEYDFHVYLYIGNLVWGDHFIYVWDWTNSEWDTAWYRLSGTEGWLWINFTLSDSNGDYWDPTSKNVTISDYHNNTITGCTSRIDYLDCEINAFRDGVSSSTEYQEPFNDVSDWTNHNGISLTTDNDVATWTIAGDGSSKNFYTNDISLAVGAGDYFEFYIKTNHTVANQVNGWVYVYTGDDKTGDLVSIQAERTYLKDEWQAKKYHVNAPTTIESFMFYFRAQTGGADVEIYFDFFRMGDSTEFGWQHDCSTTAGVTDGGGGSSSSDGDELTLTADADGSSFEFAIDTTATAAYLDADYYPMISLDFNDGDSGDYIKVESYDGSAWATVIANTTVGTDTHYANCRAADADIEKFRISVNPSANPRLKWFKAFSIANFTVTQGSVGTDEYFYVNSGVLKCEKSSTNYLKIDYDITLGLDRNTYNICNLTMSNYVLTGQSDFIFWEGGTTHTDETRFGWASSGTLNDFQITFYSDNDFYLSAIKFIEDSTAPDILDKFVNPLDPDDDEGVTFTAVTYDAIEVYKVTLNAVVYPDGFSDVDYEMTEQTTDVLWSYEFSTLQAGYYLFGVEANDGANTYSEYIPVTIRESTITVEEITLIGAGSDFTMMQFSARINKDCSYVIYEESENNPEAATHSGSVSEPSFNLAWTKLDTTDTNVNFTIKFTNDTLTYNYTSQYQVAQTVLSVTSYDWGLSESQVTISFQTSKGGTYTVYLDDVQDSTSSFVTGSNFLNWSRPSATDPAEIDAAVKLTDGTTTIWLNQTYSEYSLTAFSIQTLFMDLTDPSISAILTTSWGNATGYLYEDDVQKATGAEGTTLSYTKSTTAGTYNVALKIDAGGEIAWYNTTYTVAVTTLQVTDDSIRTTANYAYLTGHVNLNANYIVYEETVQVGTGSVTAGSFEIRWTKASSDVENVTVLFESGSQSYPVYSGYDVAAQVTFVVESWWMDLNLGVESYVEFYVLSSFENATVYVYDNNTLMTTVTESAGGVYSYFWMSESEGLHTITLNITHGATVHTRTRTYYIPDWAATGLVVRWDLWTFQDNYTMLELGSNWMNCTYYIYLNGSLVATSANDPVTLNFTRAINVGEYNLTIHADAGAQTYTIKNIRYIITEEGVTYDYSSITGGRSVRYGDTYEGDDYAGDTYENPPGIYMTAETAATIAVSTVFIFFLAVLFMNSRVKKAQLDRDKKETQ